MRARARVRTRCGPFAHGGAPCANVTRAPTVAISTQFRDFLFALSFFLGFCVFAHKLCGDCFVPCLYALQDQLRELLYVIAPSFRFTGFVFDACLHVILVPLIQKGRHFYYPGPMPTIPVGQHGLARAHRGVVHGVGVRPRAAVRNRGRDGRGRVGIAR